MTDFGIEEKNKISSPATLLRFIKLDIPQIGQTLYLTNNNEPTTTWQGIEWQGVQFDMKLPTKTSTNEVQEATITVSNINNEVADLVALYDADIKNNGFQNNVEVTIQSAFSNNLDNANSESEVFEMILEKPKVTTETVIFTLTVDNGASKYVTPKVSKDRCPYTFKDIRCGYVGASATCDKTYSQCISYGNGVRFGGEPFAGNKGIQL